jgi:glycerol-3-phosphate cytidylyltransferase
LEKFILGYTTGVYDLFHIGHLNLLKRAKENCDYLIVGVTTDEETIRIKNKKPIIPYENRLEIIKSIKYVDKAVEEDNSNKLFAWDFYKFNVIFKGDDWKGTPKWLMYEEEFSKKNVKIIYLPYTKGISSTLLTKNFMISKN